MSHIHIGQYIINNLQNKPRKKAIKITTKKANLKGTYKGGHIFQISPKNTKSGYACPHIKNNP